ncbi:MAG: NADH-quinone oxidoreductase subunit J [Chlamydiae bacterium]|nr:NADH-quinone oxidoreductase subunit J [Chlamydiota bacterium]MBI3265866.1 NADH-quinone oxidoreductase subunit J [Chlamydiota bacterium]
MTLQNLIFIILSVTTLAAAVMAVSFKKVIYNAFSLMLCLGGIAGIFFLLSSEFLAVMEIIVYVGAIAIAIIFAIMFSPPHFMHQPERNWPKTVRSIAISAFFFATLYKVLTTTPWGMSTTQEADFSIQHLGKILLGIYTLPFEVISIILFIAILGALLMARKREAHE